ncbi:MAG: glycosyltransferase [Acidimicrobiia bacterium]|nr:glycosyltransferase [Actinomycetota bacterium]NCV97238.1 glycosyltransferase [Acidimicrobiia bacterium]
MIDWSPSLASTAIFVVGWSAGWWLWLRAKSLPTVMRPSASSLDASPPATTSRPQVSVIVPCRNEAANLPHLMTSLAAALHPGDELIIVDDGSVDETANLARAQGATVLINDVLPAGWAGKPYACWRGAGIASREVLVFLDADVRLGASSLDSLCAVLRQHPNALVSVMPWHRTHGVVERLSMLFNLVSSLVASISPRGTSRRVAYGPCMAVRRDTYMTVGGHAHLLVRAAVVEDLALARVMPDAVALVGRQHEVEYRMYPDGFTQLVEGWTKNTATGAVVIPRVTALLIIAWITSLCGGVVTSPWFYLASLAQLVVMLRRVGNFGPLTAAVYPLHAVFFVAIAAWSAVRSAVVGNVVWRGRRIPTR